MSSVDMMAMDTGGKALKGHGSKRSWLLKVRAAGAGEVQPL
jgi:hypothetical protein